MCDPYKQFSKPISCKVTSSILTDSGFSIWRPLAPCQVWRRRRRNEVIGRRQDEGDMFFCWKERWRKSPTTPLLGGGFKYFYFHPNFGKISTLTNPFQTGWNHQLVYLWHEPWVQTTFMDDNIPDSMKKLVGLSRNSYFLIRVVWSLKHMYCLLRIVMSENSRFSKS